MNTTRRARKRPRVRSVSFRTFFWLLAREAALRVLSPHALGRAIELETRAALVSVPTETLARRVRRWLNFRPDRRHYL